MYSVSGGVLGPVGLLCLSKSSVSLMVFCLVLFITIYFSF